MNQKPPHRAHKFLRWFCREDYLEEVEGDLIEVFEYQFKESSSKAKRKFTWSVIKYFRPEFIKAFSINYHSNSFPMLYNYLKVSWRNLTNQKLYSTIKIGGFSMGVMACLLIALFIHQELTYDKHYKHSERIYRVFRETTFNGDVGRGAHFPAPFAETLKQNYPEIENVGRYNAAPNFGAGSNEVRRLDGKISEHEEHIAFADQSTLEILEVAFVSGNPKKSLSQPNTIVITESISTKYFSNEDPLGKVLVLNNDETRQYKITGVIKDFPITSHFKYDFLISLADKEFYKGEQTNWKSDNYITYVSLHPEANAEELEQKLSSLVGDFFLPPRIEAGRADDIAWIKSLRFKLQPVNEIYLNLDKVGDNLKHGDIRYIWLFAAVAFFILVIACMNFINLSTAKSANRAKEVGLRKVIGSQRSNLIRQFLTESILLSFLAHLIALLLAFLVLPYFNEILRTNLTIRLNQWWIFPILVATSIGIGFLAGIYPAFFLSSFKPIQVLKGKVSMGSKNSSLRNALVIFQFSISIALIVSTVVIYQQMDYILNKKLGFDKDQVLLLHGTRTLENQINVFKNELLQQPGVSSASISSYLPVGGTRRNNGGWKTEIMPDQDAISGQHWAVDTDYVKTLGLNIIEGRSFSRTISSDSQAVIINKSLAKALKIEKLDDDQVYNWLGGWTVIGIVEDFHFESMKNKIRPLGMFVRSSKNTIAVKIDVKNTKETVESVTNLWQKFSPNQSIRYSFLDQQYARMYDNVQRIGNILNIFALLAIIIACLGLFALSSYMIQQRSKEVSIRLVLGASLKSIFYLLTHNFISLILLALVIAVPLAWYMMTRWLQEFAYQVSIDWTIFLITGISALLIAFITVSFQSIRTATMNPVDNLKSE